MSRNRVGRLTPLDLITLWPDDAGWQQDIGVIAVLDGGAVLGADGRVAIEAVQRLVDARWPQVPRLRHIVHVPRFGLGRPLWVDAPAFDVRDHVRAVPPLHDGDEAQLLATVEWLRRRPLDRSRPLWELWCIPGLAGGTVGLYFRAHHVIADGVSGAAMLAALLDPAPTIDAAPAAQYVAAPIPDARDLFADNVGRWWTALARTLGGLARPTTVVRRGRSAWSAARAMVTEGQAPRSSLNRPVGADREVAVVRSSLDVATAIAHRYDAKVNDVLLTAVAGGLRELLCGRGESTADLTLRAFVPVSLHRDNTGQPGGNRLGQMIARLPLGEPDPVRRLALIAADTATRKRRVRPRAGAVVGGRIARSVSLRILARQRIANISVANVPGPPIPMFFAGAAVREIIPVVALMGNIALGVGAFSYAGQFTITVVGDSVVCPAVAAVAHGIDETMQALAAAPQDEQQPSVG